MESPIAVVTGGAGFIGSHLADVLVGYGFRVRIIDTLVSGRLSNIDHLWNQGVSLDEVDILDLSADSAIFTGAQYVFHLAGIGEIVPSIEKPVDYLATNVQGTVRVLECARHAGVEKLVYAASSSCYGIAEVPTREDHPIRPQYPYALSKYLGEEAVLHWHLVYRLPVNSIRIFNAYGPRIRTSGTYGAVFGVFFRQKLAGKPFTVVGDGTQSRDFVYASDVARGFLSAAQTQRSGEVYNLGAGTPQTVNHLVELIGGEVVYIPKRPGEPECTFADITKISSHLGWKPEVSFEEGVQRMLMELDHWADAPLWDPQAIAAATATWFRYLS